MHEAVMRSAAGADVVIMAAAVADYAPAQHAAGKISKIDAPLTLTLERTKDILADLGAMRDALGGSAPVLVGFAAETEDVVERARAKRARKNLDMIVANDVSAPGIGFNSDDNAVSVLWRDGEMHIDARSKTLVARELIELIARSQQMQIA